LALFSQRNISVTGHDRHERDKKRITSYISRESLK
jgi:hypothetical protein